MRPENILDKIEEEKKIVGLMIKIYCKGHNHVKNGMCEDCQDLLSYSNKRVDLCPFMEIKTFCENCEIHCYKEDMRARIKEVMRYSGPRMIFYHPFLAISHAIESHMGKRRRKKERA